MTKLFHILVIKTAKESARGRRKFEGQRFTRSYVRQYRPEDAEQHRLIMAKE